MSFKLKRRLGAFAAAGAYLAASPSLADAPATPVSQVVVSAAPQPAASSLPRSTFADGASGSSDTADLLGLDSEAAGGFSSRPVIHGLGDERINILVDGTPVALACPNHMNPPLSYTDPQTVRQATVIAGISPVSLGGDSLGGTIVIDTQGPQFSDTSTMTLSGEASANYRSNGDGAGGSLAATLASDRLSLAYAGSVARSGDYRGGGSDGLVRSTEYETTDQTLALAAKTQAGQFDLRVGLQDAPYEAFPNAFMDMTLNRSWNVAGGWLQDFGWGEAKIRFDWRDTLHKMNFLADKGGDANGGMPMDNRTRSGGVLAETDVRVSATQVLRLGGEVRGETLTDNWPAVPGSMTEGPESFLNMNHGVRTRLGAFAEWEAAWNSQLSTVLGVRGDRVWMNAGQVHDYAPGMSVVDDMAAAAFNATDRGRRDDHFDFAALARWRPAEHASFDLGISQKTRSPGLYERYAWAQSAMSQMNGWFGDGNGYVGNLNLKPEVAETVGGSAELTGGSVHPWTLKANPWFTRVRDFIGADQIGMLGGMPMGGMGGMGMGMGGPFVLLQFANHRAELYGADLSGSVRLWNSASLGKLELSGSASTTRGTDLDTRVPLYHIMPPKGRLKLDHSLGPWGSRLEVVAVARKDRVDITREEPETGGYTLVNLGTAYSRRRFKLEGGIDNLFDTAWTPPLGGLSLGDYAATGMVRPLPGRGRSINVGLSASF